MKSHTNMLRPFSFLLGPMLISESRCTKWMFRQTISWVDIICVCFLSFNEDSLCWGILWTPGNHIFIYLISETWHFSNNIWGSLQVKRFFFFFFLPLIPKLIYSSLCQTHNVINGFLVFQKLICYVNLLSYWDKTFLICMQYIDVTKS